MWHESKELELMDEALVESFSSSEAKRCIHVGLLCIQDYAENRPSISEVVSMLSSETELPQPKRPTFYDCVLNRDRSESNHIWSTCAVTESVLEGR